MQRHSHGEDEREHFEPVEGPAEVRGEQRLPLRAVKRAIPGRHSGGGEVARGLAHKCLPDFCAAAPGGRSLAKTLRRDRVELEGWERWAYRAFVKNALAAYSVGSLPLVGRAIAFGPRQKSISRFALLALGPGSCSARARALAALARAIALYASRPLSPGATQHSSQWPNAILLPLWGGADRVRGLQRALHTNRATNSAGRVRRTVRRCARGRRRGSR